jgi:hypothetical protein
MAVVKGAAVEPSQFDAADAAVQVQLAGQGVGVTRNWVGQVGQERADVERQGVYAGRLKVSTRPR